jgi:hypothetical protein
LNTVKRVKRGFFVTTVENQVDRQPANMCFFSAKSRVTNEFTDRAQGLVVQVEYDEEIEGDEIEGKAQMFNRRV